MEDTDSTPAIGRRIKAIRKFLGDSQKEFVVRLGMQPGSQSEVGKWEDGEVPVHRARQIAELVNAEPAALERDDHQFCHGVRFGARAVLHLLREGPISAFWDDGKSEIGPTGTRNPSSESDGPEEGQAS